MEFLNKRLNKKDIRAVKTGCIVVAGIVLFAVSSTFLENWQRTRKLLSEKQTELKTIVLPEAKLAGLTAVVPVFEIPQNEEKQKFLFRNKLKEQLKKAGIKTKPLKILTNRKNSNHPEYKLLYVKCSSEACAINQIFDLLASLKENPYLAGIEELNIRCDPKNREKFNLDIILSTFVK